MQRKKAMTYGVSFSTQANSYSSKYGACNDNSRNNKYGRGYQKSYTNVFFSSRKEETFKETVEIRDRLQNELYVPTTKVSLKTLHQTFYGGQFPCHAKEWEKLTSDHTILQMVKSDIIKFKDKISLQHLANNQPTICYSRRASKLQSIRRNVWKGNYERNCSWSRINL